MKITAVTPFVLGTQWRNLFYVKVETDEGLVGVGERAILAGMRVDAKDADFGLCDAEALQAIIQRAYSVRD